MKKIWREIGTIVLGMAMVVGLIYLLPYVLIFLRNQRIENITNNYLESVYKFDWELGEIDTYNVTDGTVAVEVFPKDDMDVEQFEVRINSSKVVADTYIREYMQKRLERVVEKDIETIWGNSIRLNIGIVNFSMIEKVPLCYTKNTMLEEIFEMDGTPGISYYNVAIYLEQTEEKEIIEKNMWETIVYLKNQGIFPSDEQLRVLVTYEERNGIEQHWVIEDIQEVENEMEFYNKTRD